jgi:membrane-bound metal-dependent hydrolase YbcI (DUF457 family)
MFAIGHFALGYLTGKATSSALHTKLNLPLLIVASILPDIDLLLGIANPSFFMHRGPTHSIITFTVVLMPFLLIYGKKALPYYIAALSHSLIGDFFTGGIEMLWPITQNWYGNFFMEVGGLADAVVELSLFVVSVVIMIKARDLQTLFEPKISNLALFIGFGALIGPMLNTGNGLESNLPVLLIAPSLFWIVLFAYSMLLGLKAAWNSPTKAPQNSANGESLLTASTNMWMVSLWVNLGIKFFKRNRPKWRQHLTNSSKPSPNLPR